MAHSPRVRSRARELYVGGWGYDRIAAEVGVSKSTLIRWARAETWADLREHHQRAEHEALALFESMATAARDSGDPQQAYAAAMMARLAGVGGNQSASPRPTKVAEALLDALALHPDVGPVVRRHRREVVRLMLRELDRLDPEPAGMETR